MGAIIALPLIACMALPVKNGLNKGVELYPASLLSFASGCVIWNIKENKSGLDLNRNTSF
jgi:hypothetical protein